MQPIAPNTWLLASVPNCKGGVLFYAIGYTASTVAYQGYGRGLNLQIIQQINQIATGGLGADLVLWLDLPVSVGLARTQQRGTADRLEQNAVAFHERVRQGFIALAEAGGDRWQRIDADHPSDQVSKAIQDCLAAHLHRWFQTLKRPPADDWGRSRIGIAPVLPEKICSMGSIWPRGGHKAVIGCCTNG